MAPHPGGVVIHQVDGQIGMPVVQDLKGTSVLSLKHSKGEKSSDHQRSYLTKLHPYLYLDNKMADLDEIWMHFSLSCQ